MVRIEYDDSDARKRIQGLLKRMKNTAPAMRIMGEIAHESILTNFEEGGRPKKWKRLKPATIKERKRHGKWPGRILVRSGVSGGLMGSIKYRASAKKVVLSAHKVYARIHHKGGKAGRGHKVTIPARPYMVVQKEDWREMEAALNDYVILGRA